MSTQAMSVELTSSGTVARVALLLRVLAENENECGLGEIAERMHLPPSTTHRLLKLLLEQGFVERGQRSRTYRPGMEYLRVSGLVSARAQITNVAHEPMRAVVAQSQETCVLSVYLPTSRSATIAAVVHGTHALRYEATLHRPSSLLWGATGLGVLAFLPSDAVDDLLKRPDPSPASGKAVNPAQVRREIAIIRQRGYALTRGQKIPGAVGMSAPVFNSMGVVAALCITLPLSRFAPAMEPRLAKILMEQAARLSNALGGDGPRRTD